MRRHGPVIAHCTDSEDFPRAGKRESQPFRSRANSLPWSESANRTLANSLSGTFAPWPFRSLAFSLPGLLAPCNFRSLALSLPGLFASWPSRSLELSFPGANWPRIFRTQENSLPGTFALWNFRSLLVRDIICDVSLY